MGAYNIQEGNVFFIDDSQFNAFVEGMKSQKVRKLEKKALRKTGAILQSETKKQLRREKGTVIAKSKDRNQWYKGIRLNVGETTNHEQFWYVHILGYYMLKWFEMGTAERITETERVDGYRARLLDSNGSKLWLRQRGTKPHKTGRIKPLWFFKTAAQTNKARLFHEMDENWKKIIVTEFTKQNIKGFK